MNIEDIVMRFVKYRVTRFDIVIPGYNEPYTVDRQYIGDFTIEKDFENWYFPYIEFNIVLPKKVRQDILLNHENIYVDVRVEYAQFEDIYETDPNSMLYSYGTILDGRFYALLPETTPKLTMDTIGDEESNEMDYDQQDQLLNPLQMALYNPTHLFNTNQIINAVLQNATVPDAVIYMLQTAGIRNVLMSPAQKSSKMSQLIITPIPFFQQLERLCNSYRMHDHGTMIFFDYDYVYILDKKLGCTAFVRNEYKTTYLVSLNTTGEANAMKTGFYSNSQEKYTAINITGNNIAISGDAVFNEQLVGNSTVIIDSNTGEVSSASTDSQAASSTNGKVKRVIVQNVGDNPGSAVTSEYDQNARHMSLTFRDINIRALAPNKDFIFTTDNSKYTQYCGHYRIISQGSIFTKDGELWNVMTSAEFVGGSKSTS